MFPTQSLDMAMHNPSESECLFSLVLHVLCLYVLCVYLQTCLGHYGYMRSPITRCWMIS